MTELSNLKKNDFLAVFEDDTSFTKEEISDRLSKEYTFIPSYLDFLVEHFIRMNKIQLGEDGKYSKRVKSKQSRTMYKVVKTDNEGYKVIEKSVTGVVDTTDGFSVTKNAAIKRAVSAVHMWYKAETDVIKSLV